MIQDAISGEEDRIPYPRRLGQAFSLLVVAVVRRARHESGAHTNVAAAASGRHSKDMPGR